MLAECLAATSWQGLRARGSMTRCGLSSDSQVLLPGTREMSLAQREESRGAHMAASAFRSSSTILVTRSTSTTVPGTESLKAAVPGPKVLGAVTLGTVERGAACGMPGSASHDRLPLGLA